MDSLKALSIRTTFDTLDDDDQRKLAMDLILRAWGLCKEIVGFMAATTHPLAHMTWIHKVCGDISMNGRAQLLHTNRFTSKVPGCIVTLTARISMFIYILPISYRNMPH
jgi:hypothetical protein